MRKAWTWIQSKWAWLLAGAGFVFWYFTRPKIVDKQIQISKEEMKEHETRAGQITEQREELQPRIEQAREDEAAARSRVENLSDQELADSFIRARKAP